MTTDREASGGSIGSGRPEWPLLCEHFSLGRRRNVTTHNQLIFVCLASGGSCRCRCCSSGRKREPDTRSCCSSWEKEAQEELPRLGWENVAIGSSTCVFGLLFGVHLPGRFLALQRAEFALLMFLIHTTPKLFRPTKAVLSVVL